MKHFDEGNEPACMTPPEGHELTSIREEVECKECLLCMWQSEHANYYLEPHPGQPCPSCGDNLVAAPDEEDPNDDDLRESECPSCGWLAYTRVRCCDICEAKAGNPSEVVARQGRPEGWLLIRGAQWIVICPDCIPKLKAAEPVRHDDHDFDAMLLNLDLSALPDGWADWYWRKLP